MAAKVRFGRVSPKGCLWQNPSKFQLHSLGFQTLGKIVEQIHQLARSKPLENMHKHLKSKEQEQIKSLIASDQETNILLAIQLSQANGMSLASLAQMIYYEAARKMTSCHGYPPSTIYDIKCYFSFDQGNYGLSFSVEGIPVEGEDFVHDFDELLQIGGTSYSLDTIGLESEISINQSQEAFDLTQVQAILCQLLEEYLKDED